jgi:hypothetical protein
MKKGSSKYPPLAKILQLTLLIKNDPIFSNGKKKRMGALTAGSEVDIMSFPR